jgi:hypothetical protein
MLKWRLGSKEEDYSREGVKKGQIQLWEDGMRAPNTKGAFEWWYFDSVFPNGAAVTFVFLNNVLSDGISSYVDYGVLTPDGKKHEGRVYLKDRESLYSKEKSYIVCGDSWFFSDMKNTMIHLDAGDVVCDLRFDGLTPPYRQHNGMWYFGEKEDLYLGWVCTHPKAAVHGTLYVDGKKYILPEGSGYRDHNWGNYAMYEMLDHWMWFKVQAGNYVLSPSVMVSNENSGFTRIPTLLVLKEGNVVELDITKSTVQVMESTIHTRTGLKVPDKVLFTYENGDDCITVKFERKKDVRIIDQIEWLSEKKKALARKMNVASWYYRFDAATIVDVQLKGAKEHIETIGIYEYTQFGKGIQ